MKSFRLDDMIKGWFVGPFNPTCFSTDQFEVAIKEYKQGEKEGKHLHKIATELTVIIRGKVTMCDQVWHTGDIIQIEPGEATAFEALEDTITAVVKFPAVLGDKYIVD